MEDFSPPIDLTQVFSFPLDDFQLEAIKHLDEGNSVIVCAPTGSGKTVVAEYAVELAIRRGKRCFYTTPLKALSNQKLHDLQKKYGPENVGLLTGDTSINRDAPVVVMTTEVYRNMLYGTNFGDRSKNLANVAFVVLDECHYMNDADRGTVWEESIIYSPENIQLVGLSATVANASDLTEWIDQTHGPTQLVVSNYRPVPLRFYYFGQEKLFPLLNQGKGLNPQLKNIFGGRNRFKRGGGNRQAQMRNVPDPRDVLAELHKRDMLPAIYFLFSRRGCEEAMKKARGAGLVTEAEKRELRIAVDEIVRGNPNLESHPHLPYLFEGLSVHHAGMLPSWKGVVERLFQRGLLKVVFATETLAAGINMPARTTIISAISKRADQGHRHLTASEFLQMSGRAGRRGMDEIGHVVLLHHPFEHVEDAGKIATAPPDPLTSRFTPSYGMVLNLLQRNSLEEAKELIERSFGQFTINKELEPWFLEKMSLERDLARFSAPLCPSEPGDLPLYRKRLEAHRVREKQYKQMSSGKGGGRGGAGAMIVGTDGVEEAINAVRDEAKAYLHDAHAMPCHDCPEIKPCGGQDDRVRHLEKKLADLNRRIAKGVGRNWALFEALANILRVQGYIDGEKPSHLGEMAAAIRGTNELFLCEVFLNEPVYKDLSDAEFASLVTAIVSEESRLETAMRVKIAHRVELALMKVNKIARNVYRLQRDFDVDIPISFAPTLSGLTQMWAEGAAWDDIRQATEFDEGDVVRTIRRTVDLCRQFARAPHAPKLLTHKAMDAERLLQRDEVKDDVV